ncbi:MAG: hypothetical protein LUC42_09155, partial [Akkermansia sp.]|uniref:hypothetical protein n=1 Tax=Akkermansia sp. TaxID=1872421 RepID=UPI002582C9A5
MNELMKAEMCEYLYWDNRSIAVRLVNSLRQEENRSNAARLANGPAGKEFIMGTSFMKRGLIFSLAF